MSRRPLDPTTNNRTLDRSDDDRLQPHPDRPSLEERAIESELDPSAVETHSDEERGYIMGRQADEEVARAKERAANEEDRKAD